VSLIVTVQCNDCGTTFLGPQAGAARLHGHLLRSEAKAQGWIVGCRSISQPHVIGPRDYCEHCRRAAMREGAR
jgi:hypothetical protein